MLTYIVRRLLLMIPTLIGVTMVVFFVMAMAPGGFKTALNEGSQGMGDGARRIRQETINRYALDQPTWVQYLRWLNQVSPVGFKMSTDKEWDDAITRRLGEQVKARTWIKSDQQADTMRGLALTIAAYAEMTPDQVLAKFDEAAADPMAHGPALFELIDVEPMNGQVFWDGLRAMQADSVERAVNELFKELSLCSINKSRVLFGSVKFFSPDFGNDQNKRSVGDLIGERIQITLLMNVITIPLIYVVSIFAGVLAARRRGGLFDTVSGTVMLGLYSVPAILAGTLLIAYLANVQYLHWFPASGMHDLQADAMPFLPYMSDGVFYRGYLLDFAWHLVLPIACMTYAGFAYLTKVMRGSVLETISADFVRTARAKGVAEKHILFRHVLRNSLLPMITLAAAILPSLFVGSFVVEYIFSIQGMGLLTIEAAKNKDVNIMMATTLIGSILSLLSLLVRDILYAIADPRVSYE